MAEKEFDIQRRAYHDESRLFTLVTEEKKGVCGHQETTESQAIKIPESLPRHAEGLHEWRNFNLYLCMGSG